MMELGGKNAFLVLEGCDLDEIIPVAYEGAFYNNGQACTAASRIIIHRSLYQEFCERFSKIVSKIKVGDGMSPDTHIGPLVSREQQQRVLSYIELGIQEGAVLRAQAPLPSDPKYANGFFVPPTLFTDVTREMRIAQEELFGPVVCVIPFDEVEEAIEIANDTAYGLVAVVYSPDHVLAQRISRELDVGSVHVNNFYRWGLDVVPFGGNKGSGYGRERSIETLHEFSHSKTVKTLTGIGTIPLGMGSGI